jgi:hypothetical protein
MRDFSNFRQPGQLIFQTFPDFLLGLSGAEWDRLFSNVFGAVDLTGLFDREARNWEVSGYAQDNFRVSSRLTLNLGLRWEYLPPLTDELGRATTVDPSLLNPDPPSSGTLAGIVVPENFPGTVPAGVTQTDGPSVLNGTGANTWGPRLGGAWTVLPNSNRLVLRGGYGLYYSRTTGQVQTQTTTTTAIRTVAGVWGPRTAPPRSRARFRPRFLRGLLSGVRALHAALESTAVAVNRISSRDAFSSSASGSRPSSRGPAVGSGLCREPR